MKKLTVTIFLIACFALTSFSQDTIKTIQNKQKPKATYQVGSSKVTVWENKSNDGIWKNYKVEKIYMKDDKWKTSNSFNEEELLELKSAIDKAITGEKIKATDKKL